MGDLKRISQGSRGSSSRLQHLKMTKIILLCLAAATVLAFAGAENERGDRGLAENSNLRAVRSSEPASGKCKKNDKKCRRKNKRKNNKRDKNKERKNKTTGGSECLPKTCVATGVGYMKKNDMVRNFEAQKKRLERFVKQANSKANKSSNFVPLIVKL